jgi:hypothetical protein
VAIVLIIGASRGIGLETVISGGLDQHKALARAAWRTAREVAPALLIASTTLSSKVGHVMGHAPHSPKASL